MISFTAKYILLIFAGSWVTTRKNFYPTLEGDKHTFSRESEKDGYIFHVCAFVQRANLVLNSLLMSYIALKCVADVSCVALNFVGTLFCKNHVLR